MNRTCICLVLIVSCLVFGTSHIEAQPHITAIYERTAPTVITVLLLDENNDPIGFGSGFIIDSDGWIVTNNHVIDDAFAVEQTTGKEVMIANIVVKINNDMYEDVNVFHRDETRDFALLKIRAASLPCVNLGNSDAVQIGEEVIAIGNPQGLERTLSKGNISHNRRLSPWAEGCTVLQTTALTARGSSGGPLINMEGQVIGITTGGINEGNLKFAVPINYVRAVLPDARAVAGDDIACGGASPASTTGTTARSTSPIKVAYAYRPGGQGQFIELADGGTMRSGDHYKIIFSPMQDSYVYIFQGDTSGWLYLLYPLESFKGVAVNHVNPVRKGEVYFVPSRDKSFRLDKQQGPERFYVLMSPQREIELEQYYQEVVLARRQNKSYDMQQAQKKVLAIFQKKGPLDIVPDAARAEAVSWQEEGQAFSALWQYLEGSCDACVNILTFMHE